MKKILLIIGLFLFINEKTDAQIVYTDINPDSIFNGGTGTMQTYDIDINNDGSNDYRIKYRYNQIFIETFGSNTFSGPLTYPQQHAFGDTISSALYWRSASSSSYAYIWDDHGTYGNFHKGQDRFIGLKIQTGNSGQYGWLRFRFTTKPSSGPHDALDSLIIKDFAYETVAGKAIIAGETGAVTQGIGSLSYIDDSRIYYSQGKLRFLNVSNEQEVNCMIYDLTGKGVKKVVSNGEVDLTDLTKGIYIVRLELGSEVYTKKIAVIN